MAQQITAYIGLGSNLGDGLITLRKSWDAIGNTPQVTLQALSAPYLSAPVGMESENWFTNGVGRLQTSLAAHDLLRILLEVEKSFGRRRDPAAAGYQDRTLDLDLLYFGTEHFTTEELTLPHPLLGQRLFVLEPLTEIAPDLHDPLDGLTPQQKLNMLKKQMEEGLLPMQEIRRAGWADEK